MFKVKMMCYDNGNGYIDTPAGNPTFTTKESAYEYLKLLAEQECESLNEDAEDSKSYKVIKLDDEDDKVSVVSTINNEPNTTSLITLYFMEESVKDNFKDNCYITSLKTIEKILKGILKEDFEFSIEDFDRVYLNFKATEELNESSVGLWEYLDVLGEFYGTDFDDYAVLGDDYDKNNVRIVLVHPDSDSIDNSIDTYREIGVNID